MTKRPINLRIEKNFLQEFDKLEGSRTEKIEEAMNMYIHSKENVNKNRLRSSESIKNLWERIIALEEDKKFLQERLKETERANEELRKGLAFEQQAHYEIQKALPLRSSFWNWIRFRKK